MELLDTPYFNIATVKACIHGCEALHENCVEDDTDSRKSFTHVRYQ